MDPISDMFIRIKNAHKAHHEEVQFSYSKFKFEIAKLLERIGYVEAVERKGKRVKKTIEIVLRYDDQTPAIRDIKVISKQSRHLYASYRELKQSFRGGAVLVSTPKGLMTSSEARKAKVGGELVAEIW